MRIIPVQAAAAVTRFPQRNPQERKSYGQAHDRDARAMVESARAETVEDHRSDDAILVYQRNGRLRVL